MFRITYLTEVGSDSLGWTMVFRTAGSSYPSLWSKVRNILWRANDGASCFYQCDADGNIIKGGLTARSTNSGISCFLV